MRCERYDCLYLNQYHGNIRGVTLTEMLVNGFIILHVILHCGSTCILWIIPGVTILKWHGERYKTHDWLLSLSLCSIIMFNGEGDSSHFDKAVSKWIVKTAWQLHSDGE